LAKVLEYFKIIRLNEKIKYLYLFFSLVFTNTYAQRFSSITYNISLDSLAITKLEAVKEKNMTAYKLSKDINDATKNAKFSLVFDKNESIFMNSQQITAVLSASLNAIFKVDNFYSNIKLDKRIKEVKVGEYFNILYPKNFHNWDISYSETKEIGKFKCKKAKLVEAKSEVFAWYCPDIPVSYGPGIYFGLPGLILEVVNPGKHTIYASKISLNDATIKVIPNYTKGQEINLEEFNKKIRANAATVKGN
jgi:GLPGLI family protein